MSADADFLPFHADEKAAQLRAGVRTGRTAPIRPFMPEQHRAFFPLLPYLFTATPDGQGWPMASVLTGPRGFVTSPDPTTLRIDALPRACDPAAPGFAAGAEIGLLGLDLATRRRNRANGQIVGRDDGLTVHIAQSFGNCPQYIQTRAVAATTTKARSAGASSSELHGLDEAARDLIESADTFFVASRGRRDLGADGGFDMSHRGGRPGFVAVQGDTLVIPDFRGNGFFNTLGNLLGDPKAGLLFIDFSNGQALQVQGIVTIDWQATAGDPAGAERLWRVKVVRAWRTDGAFPYGSTFGEASPATLLTGVW
jgi:predicted pyridoxine 5'-phosphate oxidase superfamily flavin-nucleotide-binding protein